MSQQDNGSFEWLQQDKLQVLGLAEGHIVDMAMKAFICGMVAWQTLTDLRSEIEAYRSQVNRKVTDG